jgi:hypothetical protein
MDFSQIITYLLNDTFVFVFLRILLNIFSTIMIIGLIKAGLKLTKIGQTARRTLQMVSNVIIGGILGYILYEFSIDINILLGSCCGFFSAVIYKIGIKKIYDKYGVNCDSIISTYPPSED